MKQNEINQLFKSLDLQGVEEPTNFDRDVLLKKVAEIKLQLEDVLEVSLEMDANVQDATFSCNLGFVRMDEDSLQEEYTICLTFSNFGNLCLIWGKKTWITDHDSEIEIVKTLLLEHGFTPVFRDQVSGPYGGIHKIWLHQTWLDRFFAYY